jgi:hypothetical protein
MPDASDEFDPSRERGEETPLCISLDGATLNAVHRDFADSLIVFGK